MTTPPNTAVGTTDLGRIVFELMRADKLHQIEPLIAAHRDLVLTERIPAWEAVYEPGNVSDYLIGYTNDEIPAKRAAEAWLRAQRLDEVGTIDWISDPVMAAPEYDVWHELVEVGDDFEVLSKPGIIVRHRAALEG